MNNYPTKFCINCQKYYPRQQLCIDVRSIRHVAPVSGVTLLEKAIVMRSDPSMCGMEASWFFEKEPKSKNIWRRLREEFKR